VRFVGRAVRLVRLVTGICVLLIPVLATAAGQSGDCAALVSRAFGDARVISAHAGSYPQAGSHADSPAFCEVQGVASPVPGSHVGFAVWLPSPSNWSGRLHMVGNGAYGSNLYYAQLAARVSRGDVAVATDTGHTGSKLTFGKDNPEAIVDWGHRAVHETVLAAKSIVKAYYGQPQRYSYFSGSSTGGHQALTSAQRYPDDFDGIIAGAPGNNRTNLNLSFLWEFVHNHRPGDNTHQIIPNAKLTLVHEAIVQACDRADGVADRVVNDPRDCHFDLSTLKCPPSEADNCLTGEQIAAMRAIYQGPRDSRNGKPIYPGMPFSSEGVAYGNQEHPGWSNFWADPDEPTTPARADFFRYWVFHDPGWDWWKFNWGTDVDTVTKVMGPIVNATSPDLARFRAHGGKLILFIGWADPVGSAFEAIKYYESVVGRGAGHDAASRLHDTQTFARLYLVPGMSHTAGGPGATNFSNATRDSAPPVEDSQHDMALALIDWVERGVAPGVLIATHFSTGNGPAGTVQFQRPLCVYPLVARYRGGNPDLANSFECVDR
jgi:feruloyl esterase